MQDPPKAERDEHPHCHDPAEAATRRGVHGLQSEGERRPSPRHVQGLRVPGMRLVRVAPFTRCVPQMRRTRGARSRKNISVVPPPPCPAGTEAWPRGPPPLVHHVVGETSVGTTCRAGALTRPRRAHRDVLLPKLQLWQEILPHGAPLVPLERPRPRVHGRPPPRDPRHGVCNRGVRARPARVRQLRNGHEGLHEGIP